MPSFTPDWTKLPASKSKSGAGGSPRPYTALMMSAVRLGFSMEELRTMRYPLLLFMVHEFTADAPKGNKEVVKEATQSDINALLGY